jgi:hypothetical protein
MPTPLLSVAKHRLIHKLAGEGKTLQRIAKLAGVGVGTASKWVKIPLPVARPASVGLPASVAPDYEPFAIDTAGHWLVLSDLHLPYHDVATVTAAVEAARKRKVAGVLLNGDVLDSHEVSNHDRDPTAPRYVEEVEVGKQFLGWLRSRLPKARLVLKEGNHEERLTRYVTSRAPALFDLEGVTVPELLHCRDYGANLL